MNRVDVSLGERSYTILLGEKLLDQCGSLIAERLHCNRTVILSSGTVAPLHASRVAESLQAAGIESSLLMLAEGEGAKTLAETTRILSEMARLNLDRKTVVIALGGGSIGDAAGFLAGIYMRGLRWIQIPTTLLAMVDSSVGGKTGVNLPEGKNLVGLFHQPSLVIIDPLVLKTLPPRQINSGMAEVIKYGIIADAPLFDQVKKGTPKDWTPIIQRCCEIKARIVEQDEFETRDLRALLNFGHTIGHAIEAAAEFGQLQHGEAISIGMAGAAWLSVKRTGLAPGEAVAIIAALQANGLPVHWPELDPETVQSLLLRDKKFSEGKMRFILVDRIGHAFVSEAVLQEDLKPVLENCQTDRKDI